MFCWAEIWKDEQPLHILLNTYLWQQALTLGLSSVWLVILYFFHFYLFSVLQVDEDFNFKKILGICFSIGNQKKLRMSLK